MNFLDVKTDFAFKKVFGTVENKDILLTFAFSNYCFFDKN